MHPVFEGPVLVNVAVFLKFEMKFASSRITIDIGVLGLLSHDFDIARNEFYHWVKSLSIHTSSLETK